jgi:hypothetical protein
MESLRNQIFEDYRLLLGFWNLSEDETLKGYKQRKGVRFGFLKGHLVCMYGEYKMEVETDRKDLEYRRSETIF